MNERKGPSIYRTNQSADLVPNHARGRLGRVILNGFTPDASLTADVRTPADISGVSKALKALEKGEIRFKKGRF